VGVVLTIGSLIGLLVSLSALKGADTDKRRLGRFGAGVASVLLAGLVGVWLYLAVTLLG
jgi:hypothetical protein